MNVVHMLSVVRCLLLTRPKRDTPMTRLLPGCHTALIFSYKLALGGKWGGGYRVADVSDFVGKSLHVEAPYKEFSSIHLHTVDTLNLGKRRMLPLEAALRLRQHDAPWS